MPKPKPWVIGPWEECNHTCGMDETIETRSVTCQAMWALAQNNPYESLYGLEHYMGMLPSYLPEKTRDLLNLCKVWKGFLAGFNSSFAPPNVLQNP